MDEHRICAREECESPFLPAVHNQKYCSPECCRLETNARLIEQYHARKRVKGAKKRVCARKDCDTILSQYNKESICESCKNKRFKARLKKWGWDVEDMEI